MPNKIILQINSILMIIIFVRLVFNNMEDWIMHTITINIKNKKLLEKVEWFLESIQNEGLEIVSKENLDDLKLLKATRKEKSITLDEYLDNEN